MAKRTYRKRRSREELKISILRSATILFSQRGYSALTIREIAEAAEVALPILYRLFADKRDIYVQCARRAQRWVLEGQNRFFEEFKNTEIAMFNYMKFYVKHVSESSEMILLNRIYYDKDESILVEERERFRRSRWYAEMNALGRKGGDVPQLRMFILSTFVGGLSLALRRWPEGAQDFEDMDAFLQKMLSILLPNIDWEAVAQKAKQLETARRSNRQQIGLFYPE
ncbi:MAG: TetR/AcrR family transcriptional regulator [Amphiplicatus sp.]